MYLIARSPSRIALLLRAYLDVFRLLPEALRKRRAIQGRRAVEERDIKRFFNGWI
jgi:hypothetical protein